MWWNKNAWKVILPLLAAVVLAAAFWYGDSAPGMGGRQEGPDGTVSSWDTAAERGPSASAPDGEAYASPDESASRAPESAPIPNADSSGAQGEPAGQENSDVSAEPGGSGSSGQQGMALDPATGTDPYGTEPVPDGKPVPVEPQDANISDGTLTCTLSVRCDTILNNLNRLNPEKADLVPADGVIFPPTTVTFYEGESVFNVLQREMKKAGIHMEFENTPLYNSAYIEGIHNLYEFDCGEQSGWMYKVNGWFPNYGCSRYQLQEGDVVEWVYTCDQGADVGGAYAAGG